MLYFKEISTCCGPALSVALNNKQVNNADRTEVDLVTYCDELQVDKVDRTEVEVVTHCDELQVDKADRTEVEVTTYKKTKII
jgi:hypothetical protein